ncbi:MAG: type II toxin-antitoxin system HicA family toxin [Pirellulales bacterium]
MGSLPVLKPREVAALLVCLGFQEVRQRGSHRQYRHPDGHGTTVPFHSGRGHLTDFASQDCPGHRGHR